MSGKRLKFIIILSTLLLSGLFIVQLFWINKAYQLQEKQFNYEVKQALKDVVAEIKRNSGDSTFQFDPIIELNPSLFKVGISEVMHPDYLERMLTQHFLSRNIDIDFEYSIYDCFTDSVVYQNAIYNGEASTGLVIGKSGEIDWDNETHYFSVYFPSKSQLIYRQLATWIISTLMVLLVSIFYAYTIAMILRQKRLSAIKTDFINNMTHELKTPISTIALASDVLLKPDIDKQKERLRNYAEIIKRENQRLQSQVEKVLQIATLERGNVQLAKKSIEIHGLIQNVLKVFEVTLEENEGQISTFFNAGQSVIQADEVHLFNVLMNLIDNAIKYSGDEIKIRIETKNIGKQLEITIQDSGLGIDHKDLKLIFEKFYRVPSGNVHNVKGFGLGLHYVKSMTKLMGGKIAVDSKKGEGTEFRLTFPCL